MDNNLWRKKGISIYFERIRNISNFMVAAATKTDI